MTPTEETLALYEPGDLAGTVTGSAPRSRVRAENLPHAATAVLVLDHGGRVLVHRRTATKDVFPDLYDVWVGGCVLAGEDPADAAVRELAEEVGVRTAPLEPLPRFWYADEVTAYLVVPFVARYDATRDGPLVHQESEVAWSGWLPWPDLLERLTDPSWPFVPDGRVGLHRLVAADWAP